MSKGQATGKVSDSPTTSIISLWVFHVSVGDRESRQISPTPYSLHPSSSAQQGLGDCPRQPLVSSSLIRDQLLRDMGPSGLAQDPELSVDQKERSWTGVPRQLFPVPWAEGG